MPHPYWHHYQAAISKDMEKENKKEEWEERFDNAFAMYFEKNDADTLFAAAQIKLFIRNLLSHATKEARENERKVIAAKLDEFCTSGNIMSRIELTALLRHYLSPNKN